jgi:hypothetical protein
MSNRLLRLCLVACVAAVAGGVATSASGSGQPTPTGDYRFEHSLLTSVGSATPLADLGPGSNAFKKEKVTKGKQWVYVFPQDNGVQMGTAGVVPSDVYTIAVQFRFASTDGWRRIADFKDGTEDQGFYNLNGTLQFFNYGGGANTVLQPNVYAMAVLTRDASGTLTGYLDGVQQFQLADTGNHGVIDANDVLRFFRDNECSGGACTEDSAGAVARIETFDTALTADEVAALPTAPPKPTLTLSPKSGHQGTSFTITGANFGPHENVKITETDKLDPGCNDTTGFTAATDTPGGFVTGPVSYPACAAGTKMKITAVGQTSGLKKSATFTITS